MKRLAVLPCLLLAACGTSSGAPVTVSGPTSTSAPPVAVAPPTPNPVPSFATPEAAMRYLATAWNDGDRVALKHVTDPSARDQLDGMHREATNLKLERCVRQEAGDYECTFTHDFPVGYKHVSKVGKAGFLVGPARRSGWYMTVYEYCGG